VALHSQLNLYQQRVEEKLTLRLGHNSIQESMQEAMRYSVFNGGKRVRPVLVYMVNQALGGKLDDADCAACAIEALHSYSLVHDDLPAMDDDDLRRGKPTCHIAFDEATAILAGDALQCIAFEWLSQTHPNLTIGQQLSAINVLARCAGDSGMVAGQAFDLANVGKTLTLEQLQQMHAHKTGALINAAIELGTLTVTTDVSQSVRDALMAYGNAIGLAFQVQDDILDIVGDTETLGKPQGSDIDAHKPTYPSLLGIDGAQQKLAQLHQQAITALEPLGENAQALRNLADYIVERQN
jgi:geranylgeranyl pyrophosphate synthase